MRSALSVLLFAGALASAQDVRSRTTDDLGPLEEAGRLAAAGHGEEAAARLLKVLDDPDSVDVFVGSAEKFQTLRGLRATVRERALRLAAESVEFRDAWEGAAAERLARLGEEPGRAGLERIASVFRGTAAARRALRALAARAWDDGEPVRAAELWEACGERLRPEEGARMAAGRRLGGRGPSAGEIARRWEWIAGVPADPGGTFPRLDQPVIVRGAAMPLGVYLATLAEAPPASPWRGERNAGGTAFPPVRALAGPPQVVTLFTQLPGNAAVAGGGIVFRDPGAYEGESPVKLLPLGDRAVAATRSGLTLLQRNAGGTWQIMGTPRRAAPLSWAAVATDGVRLFALVPDPAARVGAIRLVPAAFTVAGDELVPAWTSGPAPGEGGFDDGWATGPPTLHGGRLYVPMALFDSVFTPGIECLDAATGERVWATTLAESKQQLFSTTARPASSPPAVAGDLVLFASGEGFVAALDAATGDPEWITTYAPTRGETGGWADAPPHVCGPRAFFAPLDSEAGLRADLATGEPLGPAAPASLPGLRYLLADGDRVVLAGSDGSAAGESGPRGLVKVLNPSGSRDVVWELPDPPAGRPAAGGRWIAVPTAKGLYGVDLDTGAIEVLARWKEEDAGDVVRLPGWVGVVRRGEVRFWEVMR